jgi:DNA repair protein RadA/Sms
VVFGEISLSGDVRAVTRMDARLKEAAKLGFGQALCPPLPSGAEGPLKIAPVSRLADAVKRISEQSWT